MHSVERIPLDFPFLGTARTITAHRFGTPGARPKTYIQAGLHANEIPGLLVIQHLLPMLMAADAAGRVPGEIVVVPFANPVGLGTYVLGGQVGRYALESGINYNRGFPDLARDVAPVVAERLGDDEAANVATIRTALTDAVARIEAKTEIEAMRRTWLRLAIDCDYLVDLHCEEEAQFAMILGPWCWPGYRGMAEEMRPDALLLADFPPLFDTACSRPWHDLAKRFPERPIPQACLSGTFEMRGVGSVSDATASADAVRLFRGLTRMGAIGGGLETEANSGLEPRAFRCVEFLRAPRSGIVTYRKRLGEAVEAGEVVAEIVDPEAEDPASGRTPVRSTQAGSLFAKCHTYLVRADETVAKVIGSRELEKPNHY